MTTGEDRQAAVIRTERGLTIAGTRITLYDMLDYLHAGWPPKLIRDRLDLTEQQMADALVYIDTHKAEVEAEYQEVCQTAQESQQYWEEQGRERLAHIAAQPPKPGQETIRAKLQEWKAKLKSTPCPSLLIIIAPTLCCPLTLESRANLAYGNLAKNRAFR